MRELFPPWAKLKPGEYGTVNGISLVWEPKPGSAPNRVGGIAGEPGEQLKNSLSALEMPRLSAARQKAAMSESATALADHLGRRLTASRRKMLQRSYKECVERASAVATEVRKGSLTPNEAQENFASILANQTLDEAKIFAGQEKAQLDRYGAKHWDDAPDHPDTGDLLTNAWESFIRGDYLRSDAEAGKKAPWDKPATDTRAVGARTVRADRPRLIRPEARPPVTRIDPSDLIAAQLDKYEYVLSEIDLQNIGWQINIYTAEHPAYPEGLSEALEALYGYSWNDALDDSGLVHTSVVVGLYEQKSKHLLRKTIKKSTREVVEERKFTEFYLEFREWLVVNACSTTVQADDQLNLKVAARFRSEEEAKRFAKGATKGPAGRCSPMRACSYSTGAWGFNWLCHQNANAFARRKWGYDLVAYPSVNVFGWHGNTVIPIVGPVPISKRKCPVWNASGLCGGIPGNQLYYNMTPPYLGITEQVYIPIDIVMEGEGWGLDTFWFPGTSRHSADCYPTHADYVGMGSVPLPNPGTVLVDTWWNGWY